MAKFNERLKSLRTENGWSQDMLADKLGISRSCVGNYEQGTRTPDIVALEQIADLFNVDMLYLTGKQEKKHLNRLPDILFNDVMCEIMTAKPEHQQVISEIDSLLVDFDMDELQVICDLVKVTHARKKDKG